MSDATKLMCSRLRRMNLNTGEEAVDLIEQQAARIAELELINFDHTLVVDAAKTRIAYLEARLAAHHKDGILACSEPVRSSAWRANIAEIAQKAGFEPNVVSFTLRCTPAAIENFAADLAILYGAAPNEENRDANPGGDMRDARRYRWLAARFTGYDFDWMPSAPGAGDGGSVVVFKMPQDFYCGRDIGVGIDADIAKCGEGARDD